MHVSRITTPIGELTLTATETALTGVYFPNSRHGPPPVLATSQGETGPGGEVLSRARQQLAEYFARARMTFDLPLAAEGTEFEHRVWDALRAIPFGATTSYGEIARKLGDARNARA
ncbi:MAG TPA: MGMT family protein, partial [Gemmatimonadales bacterium]|nr:MGMT family protein [Gemmatimonadales bacterium]